MTTYLRYSKGVAGCVANIRQDATGAAAYAHAGIWNPSDSGVLADVEVIGFAGLAAGPPLVVGVWPIETLSPFVLQETTRAILSDRRLLGRYEPKIRSFVRSGTRVVASSEPSLLRTSTDRDTPFSRAMSIQLPPGTGLVAIMDDDNEDLKVSYRFAEYGL